MATLRKLVGNNPFSVRKLGTGRNSDLGRFLYPLTFEAHDLYDHFTGDTLDANKWALGTDGNGATAFAQRVGDATGTYIRGQTAAVDNNVVSIFGAAHFFGDNEAVLIVKMKVDRSPATSDLWIEVGFADVVSDATLPCVTDVDTPTVGNGAGDVAMIHLDGDQTLKTAAFVTEGSTASMVPTKTNLGTWQPTAAELFTAIVGLQGNTSYAAILNANGVVVASANHGSAIASQIEGGVAMLPRVMCGTRVATDTIYDIDLIRCIGGDGL